MVWLYTSPILVERGRGVFHLLKLFLPAFAAATGGGGGGGGETAPVERKTHVWMHLQKIFRFESTLFSVLYNRYTSLLTLQFPAITLKSIKF
jgi:hypothetical protein